MTSDSRTKVQPDVKLLPLPAFLPLSADGARQSLEDYARANMAELLSENERLREEVGEAKQNGYELGLLAAKRDGIDPWAVLLRAQEAEARAERLEEALRWITSNDTARDANDGMEEVETIKYRARAALEQEGGK